MTKKNNAPVPFKITPKGKALIKKVNQPVPLKITSKGKALLKKHKKSTTK